MRKLIQKFINTQSMLADSVEKYNRKMMKKLFIF